MMKKLTKLTALLAVAALLFGAVGCSDDDDDDIAVTGVTLDKERLDIKVGGTEKLTATVTPADATDKDVTWSSENDDIATVDKDGIVTGVRVGNTTITVTTVDGDKTAVCEVAVTNDAGQGGNQGGGGNTGGNGGDNNPGNEGDDSDNPGDNEGENPDDDPGDNGGEDEESVLVASITVTADKTELKAGEKATFKAVCKGADDAEPSNDGVTWSAKIGDAPAADVITADGVFTAPVHADEDKTYTITATAKDGSGTTGTAEITVKKLEPLEVNAAATYTEYFDGKANIYSNSTLSGIFEGGALATDKEGKDKTYVFTSGVKWVPGTGGKIEKKEQVIGDYTSKYRLALDKTTNNASLIVPVQGACTVVLGFQNNDKSRGFTVESTTATISNENVTHCSEDQTNGTVSVSGGNTLTYEVTGKSNNELISFDVDTADTLTIEATDGASGGTVYFFFIDVKEAN